jgi:hypothetical protein
MSVDLISAVLGTLVLGLMLLGGLFAWKLATIWARQKWARKPDNAYAGGSERRLDSGA